MTVSSAEAMRPQCWSALPARLSGPVGSVHLRLLVHAAFLSRTHEAFVMPAPTFADARARRYERLPNSSEFFRIRDKNRSLEPAPRAVLGVLGGSNAHGATSPDFWRFLLQCADARVAADRNDRPATPVSLGSRAAEILLLFLGKPGELVSKNEIMDAVWPGTAVEESNLTVQISALRRALGLNCIQTVPGRGAQTLRAKMVVLARMCAALIRAFSCAKDRIGVVDPIPGTRFRGRQNSRSVNEEAFR